MLGGYWLADAVSWLADTCCRCCASGWLADTGWLADALVETRQGQLMLDGIADVCADAGAVCLGG